MPHISKNRINYNSFRYIEPVLFQTNPQCNVVVMFSNATCERSFEVRSETEGPKIQDRQNGLFLNYIYSYLCKKGTESFNFWPYMSYVNSYRANFVSSLMFLSCSVHWVKLPWKRGSLMQSNLCLYSIISEKHRAGVFIFWVI